MKTKRIVALALAGALALGAVTPAFAEEGKKAESIAKKYNTTEEYTKVFHAQRMTVEKLQKEEAELLAKVVDDGKTENLFTADRDAKVEVLKAEKVVADDEEDIQKKADEIADKKKEQVENENAIGALKRQLNKIPNNPDKEFLDSAKLYKEKLQQIVPNAVKATEKTADSIWAKLTQEEKNKVANKYAKGVADFNKAKWSDVDKLKVLNDYLKEKTEAAKLANKTYVAVNEAYKLFRKTNGFKALSDNGQKLNGEMIVLEQQKAELENTLKLDKHLLDNAKAEAASANLEFGKAKKAYEDKRQERVAQENILDDLEKIGETLTVEQVEGVTNPAIVELGQKDKTAFVVFYMLTHQNHKISVETLKQLGLDESILKSYNDLLGDETDPKPGKSEESSQEEESKKPDESKPNEEKPDASEDKPAPIVPGKEDKPATDKKDNKKDNKKATKKSNKAPKTGDIAVLAYAGTAVLAAGAYVASKKRK